ncbi:MAG: arsenate reductase family protein, partial [Oscillospiraceae bacterium]|nr:arsenate reductase family protein [Oscillospiraceae bacterium]
MLFVCYPRCTTCRKAQEWLEARGESFESRDIKEQRPTESELRDWQKRSGLPLRRVFNSGGL